jgi:transcriptional regulator with GAF, ATPase, and Fis domain
MSDTPLDVDRLIVDLASEFALAHHDAMNSLIANGLRRAAEAFKVDRALLWQEELISLPFIASKLHACEPFSYTHVDEIPDSTDRATLLGHGLHSAAFVPVAAAPVGPYALVLGSDSNAESQTAQLREMRLLSGVFAQALARASTLRALEGALGELRDLREERPEGRESTGTKQISSRLKSNCRAVQRALSQVEQVAPMPSTVLLLGETGVGKEVFAEAIHELSPRRTHEMIRVNCSAIPSALIESELFGRERGAYTGAATRQIGRFEAANHSTIFLDEIGELSPDIQVKLLRVLESRVIERLGSTRSINVDVRIIAATNRNLEQAVAAGSFRDDLFYRLNVFPIALPPLRKRAEDIPGLVWEFIDEFSRKCGKSIDGISKRSMEALQRYAWPGNIRELRNVIERSVIRTTGTTLMLSMPDAPDASARHAGAVPHLRVVER